MATSVAVSEETRRKLMALKMEEGAKSMDELIARLLEDHQKAKLREASEVFRARLHKKGLDVGDLDA